MPILYCADCGGQISATHKQCPHCGAKVRLWNDFRVDVQKSKLSLAITVIAAILLVGFGWYLRMDAGYKTPLYVIVVIVAPLVPWLLALAYKNASPLAEEIACTAKGDKCTLNKVKIPGAGF